MIGNPRNFRGTIPRAHITYTTGLVKVYRRRAQADDVYTSNNPGYPEKMRHNRVTCFCCLRTYIV